jgi:hypothetical protein
MSSVLAALFIIKLIEKHKYYHPVGQGITRCRRRTIGRFEVLFLRGLGTVEI